MAAPPTTRQPPACNVSTLAARFPLLPHVVYFDTASQAARSATRRLLWLVRMSGTTWALERFHVAAHVPLCLTPTRTLTGRRATRRRPPRTATP